MGAATTARPPPSSTLALPLTAELSLSSQERIRKLADVVLANLAKLGATNGMPASHSRNSIEERLSKLFPTFQTPNHPTYALMIRRAIQELNEEGGSSEESISKFIKAEYQDLPWGHTSLLSHHLMKLSECGEIISAPVNCYTLPFGDNNFSVHGRRDKSERGGQLRSEREKLHKKKDAFTEKENVGVGDRSKQQALVIQVTNPPKKARQSFSGAEGIDQFEHQQVELNRLQELDVMKEGRIGVEANEVLHEAHMQEYKRIEVSEKAQEGVVQAIEGQKQECQQSRAVQLKEKHPQQHEVIEESKPPEQDEVTENQAQLQEQHDKNNSQSIVRKDEAQKQIDVVVVEENPQHQTQDNEAMEEEHLGEDLDGKLVEQYKRNEWQVEVVKENELQDQHCEALGVQLQTLEKEIAGMEELTNHLRQQIQLADKHVAAQETLIESRNRSTDVCTVQKQLHDKQGEILSIMVRPDPLPCTPTFEDVGPSHISKEKCIELLKRNKEIEGRLMAIFESWNALESATHVPRQNLVVEGKDREPLEGKMLISDIGEIEISRQMCQQEGIHTLLKVPIFNVKKQVELSSSKRPPEVEAAVLDNVSLGETQPKLSDHDLPRSLEVEPEALTTNLTVDMSAGSGSITTGASFDVPLVDLGKFKKVEETEVSAPKYHDEIFSQQKPPKSQLDAAIYAQEDARVYEQAQLLEPSYERKTSPPFKEAPALPHGPVDLEHDERSQTSYQLDGERQQELSVQGHAVVLEAANMMPPCQTQVQNLRQQQQAKTQPWGQGFLNVKGNGASAFRMESIQPQSKQLSPERDKFSKSQTSSVSASAVGLPAAVHHEQVQNELQWEKFLPRDCKLPPSEASALPLINEQENEANMKGSPIRCYGLDLFDHKAVAPSTFLPKSLQPEQQKRKRPLQQKLLQSEKMATTAKMLLLRHQHEQTCELKCSANGLQLDEPKLQIEESGSNRPVSEMNLEILHKVVDIPQQPQHWKMGRHTKLQMSQQQLYKNKLRPRESGPIQGDLGLDRVPADLLPLNHEIAVNAVLQPQIVQQGQPQLKLRGRPPQTKQQGQLEIKCLGRPPKLRPDEDGVVRTSPLDQRHQQSCGPVQERPRKRKAGDARSEGNLPSSGHAQKRRLGRPPKPKPV
ncbi:involucrin [Eucalyptus grandis]|uniref:involucrin n=1 Tax=Eucalyptus grandis TaxID=71139 RepID=UPI00192EAEE0|nr:involucrin [Eucalyptus grandis]XP_039159155.1 involucrin [Eucalyptus grandis]